jgi:very-short-patch-repair endonuclease/DNA polymerase III delta prime subunit
MSETHTERQTASRIQADQVRAGLEQIRLRLLDLTTRNKLLSFRHTASTLRIVDADLDQLYSALISGEKLPFVYVPEPTKEEIAMLGEKPVARLYAESLGWSIGFDLDRNAGRADALPTPHYKEDFETLIRKVGTTARTAIEESGVNLLHLVFGFLEWRESDDSTQVRHAPLMVVPMTLIVPKAREADRAIRVEYKDEDLTTNLSLVEKMRRDFGIEIPILEEEETPEHYFGRFDKILEQKRDWRICRQVSLGLLSFGKLLMYLDLDVERWPKEVPITEHPRLVDIFTGGSVNGLEFASEYELDEEVKRNQIPPLICDADSSQHSALIDAVRGNNLVIEGPPGTGKSQTITNLIAAFLSQGKRVLFVAEKMAALEVVKRRLDQCRLGDFCLELHSHKTSKLGLLKSLDTRIAAHRGFAESSLLPHKVTLLTGHREELTKYVKLLNKSYAAIAQSPFELIWRRDELRTHLDHPIFQPNSVTFPACHEWDLSALQDRKDSVATLQAHLSRFCEAGGTVQKGSNPWRWLPTCDLDLSGQQALVGALFILKDCCQSQCNLIEAFFKTYAEFAASAEGWLSGVASWSSALIVANPDAYSALFRVLADEADNESVQRFLAELDSYVTCKAKLPCPELLSITDLPEQIESRIAAVTALGLERFNLEQLKLLVETEEDARRQSVPAERAVRELSTALGVDATFSVRCLGDLLAARLLLDEAPVSLLHLRDPKYGLEGLGRLLRDGQRESEDLLRQCDAMSKDWVIDSSATADDLDAAASALQSTAWFKRWFSSSYRNAKVLYKTHCRHEGKKSRAQMVAGLWHFSQFKKKLKAFNERADFTLRLGNDFRGLDTAWQDVIALADWYEQLSIRLPDHIPFALRVRETLMELPASRLKAVVSSSASEVPRAEDLRGLFESLEKLHTQLPHLTFERSDARIDAFLAEAALIARQADALLVTVAPLAVPALTTHTELLSLAAEGQQVRKLRTGLNNDEQMRGLLGVVYCGIETDRGRLLATIDTVAQVLKAELPDEIKHWLLSEDYNERYAWIAQWLQDLVSSTDQLASAEAEITTLLKTEIPFSKRLSLAGLQKAIGALEECEACTELLPMWIDVKHAADRLKNAGLQYMVDAVLTENLPLNQLGRGFEFLFYDSMIRKLFDDNPDLWRMTGTSQEETRRRFVDLDKAVIELTQLDVAYRASRRPVPQGVRGTVVRETTELALVLHEISKQKQHIPIRQLMLRAGEAIQALKPCFMMSPMSVAQFLAPGRVHFDLVVMDEASQLRPEEALGAIARGAQLVVVGDPKQLPPTSFFQRTLDDEDENEEKTIAAEGESILDIALGRYQPVRRLRWHYRSQHHSLIAFSNQEFYDGDLVVFPSAYHEHPDLGVKYVPVHGVFESRRNAVEAQRVVDAVLEHIVLHPGDSLGVVTMNFEQRELIEELLDARLANDSFSSTWIEGQAETPEPFFIKNLENVQGDERDAIFISVTYGKDAQGNLFQRFSGVNSASGQRRLNVLVTRAKKRTVVFSSIDGDQIQVAPSTPWGVKALKAYLDYAKKGISSQPTISPGAEPSNEHEAAIGHVLKANGYEVVPQVGVSGYFIDLAVRHPSKPGTFLVGIEFDGKSYHSGRSARDRDRLRQLTLEKQGWKIHRIWSTDWFKNRDAEVERLLKRVRTLEAMA